jgi:hypothetical protein
MLQFNPVWDIKQIVGKSFFGNMVHTGLMVRLDYQCKQKASGGTVRMPCVAEQWWPMPLMRLVKER